MFVDASVVQQRMKGGMRWRGAGDGGEQRAGERNQHGDGGRGGETNTANDTASDVSAITQLPDLTLMKTHTGSFTQGQTGASYTLTVSNSGTEPTSGVVTVTDTLPGSLTATG